MKIVKVLAVPTPAEPNTLYMVKADANTFKFIICDSEGVVHKASTELEEILIDQILEMINQPNGIAGLDARSALSPEVRINGQESLIITDANGRVWRDIVTNFHVNGTIGSWPSFETYMGNFQGFLFSYINMEQVFCDFHIDHDYAMGTYLFPHVHWMPTTNNAGVVRWGFEYMVAKGHGQQKFSNPVTVYVNHTVPANSLGMHMVTEVPEAYAIPPTNVEPDSFVKLRVFRDAASSQDTYHAVVHGWCADLHHQIERMGTVNRAPDFFGT